MLKFQGHVLYDQLSQYAKDLFVFTGKLPSYESNGLIKQIRNLAMNLLQDFAEGSSKSSKNDYSIDKCIATVSKTAALVDFCSRLGYIDKSQADKWLWTANDLTKRLHDSQKSSR